MNPPTKTISPDALSVVILAAGQGKRMKSALPKVLQPLAGKPLLMHVINAARQLQPQEICVVFGHGGERVREAITDADLAWAKQEPQLGTGHAVLQALPQIPADGITLVLYGDVPLINPQTLHALVGQARTGKLAWLTMQVNQPQGLGRILRDAAGRVHAIVEEKDATATQKTINEINTGFLACPTALLAKWLPTLGNNNAQGEYYLTDILAMAVKDGIDVRGELVCGDASGNDVFIDVNCVFEGKVTLAPNVKIGANCVLRNCAIGNGTEVLSFSYLEGATIGAHARIGPFARIRPDTTLADEVHIGNFVEIKASDIGPGSKANHLTYIGDTTVGSKVNVGAGTIICNYDGANKHRSVIEDNVHIGSDVQLVAPITIGKGADIAAGTTVWKDIPPGEGLTLNAKTQIRKPDWKRPIKKPKL